LNKQLYYFRSEKLDSEPLQNTEELKREDLEPSIPEKHTNLKTPQNKIASKPNFMLKRRI
jgi:hypothetical protein